MLRLKKKNFALSMGLGLALISFFSLICTETARGNGAGFVVQIALVSTVDSAKQLKDDFIHTPASYQTKPLWFWNAPLDATKTVEIMEQSAKSGYAGFGVLPGQGMTPAFMTPEFLKQYRIAIDKAAELGFNMCLYDEYWFPSGSAGGDLAKQYPEALNQRLDMAAIDIQGPTAFARAIPAGKLMGAVAMKADTLERVNLTPMVENQSLTWQVPGGDWKIMVFTCVIEGARDLVDYLEPESVKKYIALTYDKYYAALAPHFGKTIQSAFYDEPTMHWIQGGRAWTPAFNEKFIARYGFDPASYYPALWFDIGKETAAARNALFGFRAELYADGFVKTLQDWCRAHGVQLTGHQDQEEIVNPVGLCGDLMKAFRDQDIPGIDQIFQYGRASKAYKVVSSAANNFDRTLVMTECYGAMKDMPIANLYKEAMDQFAKGINWMVPHAVWYDPATIVFPPELSSRSPVYGPALPAYNQYMARLQRVLQQGRHVADIGVLYPIATMQAGYRFGVGTPYEGGIIPQEADYMDVGEILSLQVRKDFTFVHPDILDERCRVENGELLLENKVNYERYKVFIIPGSKTIPWSNLKKIKQFYDDGGKVIATTQLPVSSAEFGKDAEVKAFIEAIFGNVQSQTQPAAQANSKGGKAYFIAKPTQETLRAVLADALPVYDVAFEGDVRVQGGNLSYIHKVIDGREVFFFGNSSDTPVNCIVKLRDRLTLEEWNPHTGEIGPAQCDIAAEQNAEGSRLRVVLPAVQSRFFVSADQSSADELKKSEK